MYIWNHENKVPSRLSPLWLCGTVHYVPKCIRCHKAIAVMTRRTHCSHDFIYITPILRLRDLSTLCVVDHLWLIIYRGQCLINPVVYYKFILRVYLSVYFGILVRLGTFKDKIFGHDYTVFVFVWITIFINVYVIVPLIWPFYLTELFLYCLITTLGYIYCVCVFSLF